LAAAFDLATNVSYGEAFPLVVGEAMATGVPCVVTDVGDSALIIGDTGKVVPPRDPQFLAQAWLSMIELSDEERSTLGQQARQRIIQNFSLQKMVETYEQLYEKTLYDEVE
jgi:glycosyltransferase involved in cell wall biosynthesis